MTSSNYLKGGLRLGLALPIMLVAVGLLLASLAFGLGSNPAQALGDEEGGICGYSDLLLNAMLANNDDLSVYECDSATFKGTGTAWGGAETAAADDGDDNDLDLSDQGLTSFAPGKGELDGFVPGSRIDLRGNGLTVADIDLSDATGTFYDAETNPTDYTRFGQSVRGLPSGPEVSDGDNNQAVSPVGVTFLLDGGSNSASGLTVDSFEGTENGIVWITFEYGNKPSSITKEDPDGGGSEGADNVWMSVAFEITTDDGEMTGTETVYAVINATDSDSTLYAIPYKIQNDDVIEKTKKEEINVILRGLGTFNNAVGATFATSTQLDDQNDPIENQTSWTADFNDSIDDAEEADLIVSDEDTPPVPVQDRQELVEEAIVADSARTDSETADRAKDVSIGHLAGIPNIRIGGGGEDDEDKEKLTSISADDLSGLTGLEGLDLTNNLLTELVSGVFADVGSDESGDLSVTIDLRNNEGPNGDGFTLDNIGSAGTGLNAGQVLLLDHPEDDDRIGFLQSSYDAVEGGVVEIDVNIRGTGTDTAADVDAAILFVSLDNNNGDVSNADKGPDVNNDGLISLAGLSRGNYRLAIGLPENDDEDDDNTLTILFGYTETEGQGDDAVTTMTTILDIVPITIRDAAPPVEPEPEAPASVFESLVVTGVHFDTGLEHNIPNLLVTVGGEVTNVNFLDFYNATGGVDRWGLPSTEVVEVEDGTLTQFYQRGVVDYHDTGSGYVMERRLAWDYVGGGAGGSVDQGVEDAPADAPDGGVQVGAFGHYVSNTTADGTATGFLDFFNGLGGVDAFGFPKTGARVDTGEEGTLSEPGTTAGFVRQYFQAAVFELGPDGARLTLLGDTVRNQLHPDYVFVGADALETGDELVLGDLS